MFGSEAPMRFDSVNVRRVLSLPGIMNDLAATEDAPPISPAAWPDLIDRLVWLEGEQLRQYAGSGPLITDDRPLPEYFLLRHLSGPPPKFMSLVTPRAK
jgi:hypothetical protein